MRKSFLISVILVSLVFWGLLDLGNVSYGATLPEAAKNIIKSEVERYLSFVLYHNNIYLPQSRCYPERTDKEISNLWTTFMLSNSYLYKKHKKWGFLDWWYCPMGKMLPLGNFESRKCSVEGDGDECEVEVEDTKKCFGLPGGVPPAASVRYAQYKLKSIDKVKVEKEGDYDIYTVAFTYYIESLLPELPPLKDRGIGTFKGFGIVIFDRFKEKWDEAKLDPAFYEEKEIQECKTVRFYIEFLDKGSSKTSLPTQLQSQASLSPQESLVPQPADIQKLAAFITDQWKQVIQIPPPKRDWRELATLKITGKYDDYSSLYLLGVNRRNLASDALTSADKFLKKGDFKNAQKYADLGTRHYIESNNLFNASEQVFAGSIGMAAQTLEAIYRGSKESSKYGWSLMCGPKCYEVADYVFLMTDFVVDYGLEDIDEAKKKLIISGFVKTLLKTGGVSKWSENRTTHLIGDSGPYGVMDKTINSPEFQKAFMKILAESGAYATKRMAETEAKTVIQNATEFIKGSSNLKPTN